MEYKIPKSTIRGFIDVLKDMKLNLAKLEKITEKELQDIKVGYLAKKADDNTNYRKKFEECSLVIDIIGKLDNSVNKLIDNYGKEDFLEYVPFFDVIVASISAENEFFIMIILDIIKNNAKLLGDEFNKKLEINLACLLDGYQIKGNTLEEKEKNTKAFLEIYAEYLNNGYTVISFLNNNQMTFKDKQKQVDFMQTSLEKLPVVYELYAKKEKTKIEFVSSLTPVYTEMNEVKYYIDGGKVMHLCDPKEFNELLIKNGYSDKARYDMLRKMIKEISGRPKEQSYSLIGDVLKKIKANYSLMWNYVSTVSQYLEYDILKDFYEYYYMVPGIDLGYGYTKEDILEMMAMELESVYKRMGGPKITESPEIKVSDDIKRKKKL